MAQGTVVGVCHGAIGGRPALRQRHLQGVDDKFGPRVIDERAATNVRPKASRTTVR
jgi:hypothetical protein